MKKNGLVEGTMVSYFIILITKLMGAFYVIPFYKIIGELGGSLYSYAYNVYNLFLNISISGIPTAVAIIIAEYNTLKMFNEREYAYKIANRVTFYISLVCFLVMFIFAGSIGRFIVGDITGGNSIESIKLVIRVISFCLLVIPFLSVTRGYLQGNKFISVSSSSQLVEQAPRVIIVLVGSYVAINLLNLGVDYGVAFALSGTVIGGLCALLYLKYKIHKNKAQFTEGVTSYKDSKVKAGEIIKKIIYFSIPIIIVSVTQNIYEIIDQKFIIKGLYMIGYDGATSELISSVIVTWAPKICMIITSIGAGLCSSIIPFVVSSYVKKDYKSLNEKFNLAINTILFVGMPLAAFVIYFSKECYEVFYSGNEYGFIILRVLTIVSILFSVQLVINLILQGMKKFKLVYINTIVGIVINASLDIPLILFLNKIGFHPYIGTLISTFIGQSISILIVLITLKIEYKFNYVSVYKIVLKSLFAIIFMIGVCFAFDKLLFNSYSYITNVIYLGITGLVSIGVFILVSNITGAFREVLGDNFIDGILKKLHLKKSN